MTKSNHSVKIARHLSYVLRHAPEAAEISLEIGGWVDVSTLLSGLRRTGHPCSKPLLEQIVAEDQKTRFSFSSCGTKIRANQGHSVNVDLQLMPQMPPAILYHGTARDNLSSIRRGGIQRRRRNHVHLSQDVDTAVVVGRRHGTPAVLQIDTQLLIGSGTEFFLSNNGVWLTKDIPSSAILWDKILYPAA